MENFIISVNVVVPLFLMMAVGYFLKCIKILDEHTLNKMNNVTFRVFLPLMLFDNIYKTNISAISNVNLLIYAEVAIIIIFMLCFAIIPILEKDNRRRGVLIQAIFRSNYIIFGIPVTSYLFGKENVAITAILAAIAIPTFNVLSVIALETFREGSVNIKKILLGICKNPLIIGAAVGILFLLFGIKLPRAIEVAVSDISQIATPLALIILGGSFNFSSIKNHIRQLTIGLVGRLIFVPLICITTGVLIGFRGVGLVSLISLFASPTAVSSFTMAQQMDADSELAGHLVVFTSTLCIFTIFLWIFIMKQMSFI